MIAAFQSDGSMPSIDATLHESTTRTAEVNDVQPPVAHQRRKFFIEQQIAVIVPRGSPGREVVRRVRGHPPCRMQRKLWHGRTSVPFRLSLRAFDLDLYLMAS
jgi:hypothetical protein